MNKREFIKSVTILGGAALVANNVLANQETIHHKNSAAFALPPLSFGYDALEPYIDKATMEIHYTKHHQAYVNNLNKALENTNITNLTIDEIIKNISKYPAGVRNNAGGHYNHTFFWSSLSLNPNGKPSGKLGATIDKKFGSFDAFKEQFTKASLERFGSGWAWLIVNNGELFITSTANQDNTLMDLAEVKGNPILGLDVWEHAYYLKYQNKRADYIAAFWNVINWGVVEKRFVG